MSMWESWQRDIASIFDAIPDHTIIQMAPPLRVLGPAGRKGQFFACYTERGACDFEGQFHGLPVVLDAKYTEQGRWPTAAIKGHQRERMLKTADVGGLAGVVVRMDGGDDLPFMGVIKIGRIVEIEEGGRKSLTPEDFVADGGAVLRYGSEPRDMERWLSSASSRWP